MAAANYDLYIEQGATFTLQLVWKDDEGTPIDITGYSARMQIRRNYGSEPVISLADGEGLVLGNTAGTIEITITDEQTEAITITSGRYDLELEFGGVVTRLIEGLVDISRGVTKDG